MKRFYKPELDALRLFAFLAVFCSHIYSHPRWFEPVFHAGALGVQVFFLLSAYLIVSLLLIERERTGTVQVRAFFVRRVLRIWPLYFLVIGLALLANRLPAAPQLVPHAAEMMLLMAGNVWVLRHGWYLGLISPLWSISVEEQFYLGIPLAASVLSPRRLAAVFFGVLALAYVALLWCGLRHAPLIVSVWPNSFVEFQFFAAGGLLAIFAKDRHFSLRGWVRLALLAFGAIAWTLASVKAHLHLFNRATVLSAVGRYLCALAGTVAIFVAFLDLDVAIPKWVLYLGRISFGLYAFHSMMLWLLVDSRSPQHHALRIMLALLATVSVAALSYEVYERRFLLLKRRFETVRTRAA